MAISINPALPVLAAQEVGGIAPELVLQPGSVVNAQVLKILSADLVRIAIASLSIDVASKFRCRKARPCSLRCRRPGTASALRWSGRAAMPPAASADAVTLSPDALVDAVAIVRPLSRRQERIDAGGARGGVGGGADRGHRAGQPRAAVCQSRRCRLDRQSAAETAAGDCAGAGAADQPRSKPRRRRHQDGVPEIRASSSRRRWPRVRCRPPAFPISRPR